MFIVRCTGLLKVAADRPPASLDVPIILVCPNTMVAAVLVLVAVGAFGTRSTLLLLLSEIKRFPAPSRATPLGEFKVLALGDVPILLDPETISG